MQLTQGKVYKTKKVVDGETLIVTAKLIKKFASSSLMQHTEVGDPLKGRIFTVQDSAIIEEVGAEVAPKAKEPTNETAKKIVEEVVAPTNEFVVLGAKAPIPGEEIAVTGEDIFVEASSEPFEKPSLAVKAAAVLGAVDELTVEAVKELAKALPPKDNLKKKIVEMLKAGQKASEIAAKLNVKTAYVGQIRIDYLGEGPKEGTKKYEVLKLHKEGHTPAEIAQLLSTSEGFVNQQIRLEKKRKEFQ